MVINPAKAQWDLATVKSLFYLDDVIGFKASYNGVEYHGFWGTVITGGINEEMHKATRIVEVNAPTLGQPKRTFNDAGLNTKGTPVDYYTYNAVINSTSVYATFKSAYFVDTDAYGIRYKMRTPEGDTAWIEKLITETRPQNSNFSAVISLEGVNEQAVDPATGAVIYTAFIINAEGRHDSTTQVRSKITLQPITLRLGSATADAVVYYINTSGFVWGDYDANGEIDNPAQYVTRLYRLTGENYVAMSPGNYYHATDKYTYYVVGNIGSITTGNAVLRPVDSSPPVQNFIIVTFTGYAVSSRTACQNSGLGRSVTTYRSTINNKYYTNTTLSIFVEDGFYIAGGDSIFRITSGVIGAQQGTCSAL